MTRPTRERERWERLEDEHALMWAELDRAADHTPTSDGRGISATVEANQEVSPDDQ